MAAPPPPPPPAPDTATIGYALKGASVLAQGQQKLAEADTGDSSLTCGGAASCCADWTKHLCSFFKECLLSPKNLLSLLDKDHLVGTGHGLKGPIKAWVCVNFYIGIAYDVLDMLGAMLSLELATFLPGFIAAVLYTTAGSYTWYWACISGTNVGCCLIWIKGLVLMEVIFIVLQFIDIYASSCELSASEVNTIVAENPGEEVDCSSSSVVKFFKMVLLCIVIIPSGRTVFSAASGCLLQLL